MLKPSRNTLENTCQGILGAQHNILVLNKNLEAAPLPEQCKFVNFIAATYIEPEALLDQDEGICWSSNFQSL